MLLSDPTSAPRSVFEDRVPFTLGSEEPLDLPATIEGRLPAWLKGTLVRTCPAVFHTDDWQADHWFDGLGLLYAFRVRGADDVGYQQRLLGCRAAASYRKGKYKPAGFGTGMRRSFLRRIFEPIPDITDNANVNVIAMGDELVAMTESTRMVSADRDTLAWKGDVAYSDQLGDVVMTAHPHWDPAHDKVVNVASRFGPKSALLVYEHGVRARARKLIGEWRQTRLPYVHSFGMTNRHAILIAHPLTVNSLSLLWSNRPFIDHFKWKPSDGMRFVLMDRATGKTREVTTDAAFVFHVMHAFDDGDDVVLDVVAYDDTSIVDQFRRPSFAAGMPDIAPEPVRYRISGDRVAREPLSDVGFEFPSVHYKRVSGKPQRFAWGASLHANGKAWRSKVHRLDVQTKKVDTFHEPDWVFGEPVFVAEPNGEREGQGVLVVVGTHQNGDRSTMLVLDAESLQVHAWAHVPTAIPLGFHGSFVR